MICKNLPNFSLNYDCFEKFSRNLIVKWQILRYGKITKNPVYRIFSDIIILL